MQIPLIEFLEDNALTKNTELIDTYNNQFVYYQHKKGAKYICSFQIGGLSTVSFDGSKLAIFMNE